MDERKDVDLGFGNVTRKVMLNGEVRTRMKLPNGITITTTEMPYWDAKDGVPWQAEHFRKGLTEDYVLLRGWSIIVSHNLHGTNDVRIIRAENAPYNHVHIPSGFSHIVLLGPEAVMSTTTFGTPDANPECNGNDWWVGEKKLLTYVEHTFEPDYIKRICKCP